MNNYYDMLIVQKQVIEQDYLIALEENDQKAVDSVSKRLEIFEIILSRHN